VNCPPFSISLSFGVELVGACNSIPSFVAITKAQVKARPTLYMWLAWALLPGGSYCSSQPSGYLTRAAGPGVKGGAEIQEFSRPA
jgi:hypothetical protein